MRARLAVVVIMLAVVARPGEAEAALIRFCVSHTGNWTDEGAGEDFWSVDGPQRALGQYMEVWKNGLRIWFGNATTSQGGPGQGCTGQINQGAPNGTYTISLTSKGSSGYAIEVWNAVGEPIELVGASTTYTINDLGAAGTYPLTMVIAQGTPTYECFRMYLIAAWGLWRMQGPEPSALYKFHRTLNTTGHNSTT
jgi:hypothetical protein